MHWQGVLDFTVLAVAIYLGLHWSRDARALRVVMGIFGLEAAALIAWQVGLYITPWVLHAAAAVAGLILVVLYQPELRHALRNLEVSVTRKQARGPAGRVFHEIADAAFSLATAARGALVVLARHEPLTETVRGGVPLGGEVSSEILEAIFRKVSPVHDGATLVEGGRITRVGAVLPLSERDDLPQEWGTRHRAAIGLSERSDAVVVVVSEERSEVTLMVDGTFEVMRVPADLVTQLERLIAAPPARRSPFRFLNRRDAPLQVTALGLAVVIWTATFLIAGRTVRTVVAPIELNNLDRGLQVADQTVASAVVRVRGSAWVLDASDLSRVVIRIDARRLRVGAQNVLLTNASVSVPPGIVVESLSPASVSIKLVRPADPAPAAR